MRPRRLPQPSAWPRALLRALLRALVLLLALAGATLGPAHAQQAPPGTTRFDNPLAWLEGRWDVSYTDARRGEVQGSAIIELASLGALPVTGEVLFPDPQTGALYRLELVSVTPLAAPGDDGLVRKVKLSFLGNSPPSRVGPRDGEAEPGILRVAEGATVTATLGQNLASLPVGPPREPGNLELELTAPGGRFASVSGQWSYFVGNEAAMEKGRAGSFDAASGEARGSETWRRFDTRLVDVAHVTGPTPAEAIAAAWRKAQRRGGPGARPGPGELPDFQGGFGDMWLTARGIELPVEAMRELQVSFGPVPGGQDARNGAEDNGNWRRLRFLYARRSAEDPRLLDLRVALDTGFDDTPVLVTVNGSSAVWDPEPGPQEPRKLRFVRARSDSAFEPAPEAWPGDVVYLEAVFGRAPLSGSIAFDLAGGLAPAEVTLSFAPAAPAGGGTLYRSGRILLLDPQMPDPARGEVGSVRETGLEGSPPVVVRAALASALSARRADGGGARAGLRFTDPPPSLWERALIEARSCRGGGAATEAVNYVITNLVSSGSVRRSVPITLRDHAAALVLLDELDRALGRFVDSVDAAGRADGASLRREAMVLVSLARRGQSHPLFAQRVSAVDLDDGRLVVRPGSGIRLDEALSPVEFDNIMATRPGDFLNFAIQQISRARGQARDAAAKARDRFRATDRCDVVTVLARVGLGTGPLARAVTPRLMRRPTGDEPRYPAWRPDRVARAAVNGVATLAAAVRAQQDLAEIDTDLVALPLIVAGGAAGGGLLTAAGGLLDLAIVGRDVSAFVAALEDAETGRGIATVGTEEALQEARARAREKARGVALAAGGGVAGAGLDAGKGLRGAGSAADEAAEAGARAARAADGTGGQGARGLDEMLDLPPDAADAITARALREGEEALSDTERRALREAADDLLPDRPGRPDLPEELLDTVILDRPGYGLPRPGDETLRLPPDDLAETIRLNDMPLTSGLDDAPTVRLPPEDLPPTPGLEDTVRLDAPTVRMTPEELAREAEDTFRRAPTERIPPEDLPPTFGPDETLRADAPTARGTATGGFEGGPGNTRRLSPSELEQVAADSAAPPDTLGFPRGEPGSARGGASGRPVSEVGTDTFTGIPTERMPARELAENSNVIPQPGKPLPATGAQPASGVNTALQPPVAPGAGAIDTPPAAAGAGGGAGESGRQIGFAGPDGSDVSLPLGDELGRGGYNVVYSLPGRDDAVLRLSLEPTLGGPDLDGAGRRLLERVAGGDAPIDIVRRIEDIPGVPGGFIEALSSPDPALAGRTLEIVERVPGGSAKAQIARQGGMTAGQAVAFDEAMRHLNANGLVWLDNHPGNYSFRPLGDDRWQVVVIDPGGIVPALPGELGDRAATAAFVQRALDAPPDELRGEYDFVGNLKWRWQAKRELIQESVLPGRIDLDAVGLPDASQMPFVATGSEPFAELSRLRGLDDAAAAQARAELLARGGLIPEVNPKTGAPVNPPPDN